MPRRIRAVVVVGAAAVAALSCGDGGAPKTEPPADDAGVITDAEAGAFWEAPPPIFWGDLHTHSVNSVDVYVMQTPILDGDGVRDVDALCEFGRLCSQLDFWTLTDHQTGSPPRHWEENVAAARACQARSDEVGGPVVFLGFEWQQSSSDLERNYAHKNVIFRSLDGLPARAIAPGEQVAQFDADDIRLVTDLAANLDPDHSALYDDLRETVLEGLATPRCPTDVASPDLPTECIEVADDPAALFRKLHEWGHDALVIPHGNTWGQHHDPTMSWGPNLDPDQRDPTFQRAIEIYSGHGSIESWRPWRAALRAADEPAEACPRPTADYLPCCWRAGELVRERDPDCTDAPESDTCAAAVSAARAAYLDAGRFGIATLPDVEAEAWLDCGECIDCFQPTQQYRPGGSLQAALVTSWFGDDGPLSWHWGFVGTTDSHAVGPGAGYKEGRSMSDIFGSADPAFDVLVELAAPQIFPEWERQNSYYYSGGLTGVHAASRDRDAIFSGLRDRATFATSGDRIELWFDLERDGEPDAPMGADVRLSEPPSFVVRARGAPLQAPGCPPSPTDSDPSDQERLCFGECYHPLDERHPIEEIEVVRLLPQQTPDEHVADLVADPWLVLPCPPDPDGCTVRFTDPGWTALNRPALYYVRALQSPTPQLNATGYRCERDATGTCTSARLCAGGYRGEGDDCLALDRERAWSSPIRVAPTADPD